MNIISYSEQYKKQLLNLINLFYKETIEQYNKININYIIESNDLDNNYYILLDNDIIVGYINYCIDEEYENTIMINQLFILREYRNKGLATKLINNLFEEYKDFNFCLGVVESNENAKRLYNKLGFNKPTFQFLYKEK